MILFLSWALTRLDECGVAQRVCACRGLPESWLSESCFPPAEQIVSPLAGLWALMLTLRLKPNTRQPASYERTSQPAAQPLVKPSLTASTCPWSSLSRQTNHMEGKKKGSTGSVFLRGTSCPFSVARLSSHPPKHLSRSGKLLWWVGVCRDSWRGRSSTADADAPHCSYAFIAVLQKICFSSLV